MGTLRFAVIENSWGGSPLSRLQERAFAGGVKSFPGGSPSVVAENSNGEKHVLAVARTVEEAQARAATIEQDFNALSPTEWCERYDVPVSFVPG
jgi:secreted protein with Ig-like and vWFA domain